MNKSSNIVGSPCPREIRSVSAGWSSYVAFKARFAALEDTNRAGRHINADATLRIRLPPRVCDGETITRPRMEDNRFREPVVHQLRHPFPRHPILLAASPQRAPPEVQ